MWTDISQFDIPDHLKTTAYGSSNNREFTDIGEVCVVNSMFGKAKVREIRPKKKPSLIWPLGALAVTVIAVSVWMVQDEPKPPEPMRIIVRSVASEDTASSENSKSPAPIARPAPQKPTATMAKASVVAKPVADPPVKSEKAKVSPSMKPSVSESSNSEPLASGSIQPKSSAEVQQSAKSDTAIQPTVRREAEQAVSPVVKKEIPVPVSVTEPLTESNIKPVTPASNETLPDQSSVPTN